MNAPSDGDKAQTQSITSLNEESARLQSELAALREQVERSRQSITATLPPSAVAAHVVQANEQLVMAALHAQEVAEAALSNLRQLTQSIQRDPLTGTPNRLLMIDRVNSAISLARRRDKQVGVIFLDLDRFKAINDTYGHEVGDTLLVMVAKRLEASVRESDTVSRFGGDEFLILLPEVTHAADTELLAEKIIVSFAAHTDIGRHRLPIPVSLGIALYPADGATAETLIHSADSAMYRAKRAGGGCFSSSRSLTPVHPTGAPSVSAP